MASLSLEPSRARAVVTLYQTFSMNANETSLKRLRVNLTNDFGRHSLVESTSRGSYYKHNHL